MFSVVNFRLVAASCSFRCCCFVAVQSLSRVLLFATPWTVAHQAPLSVGFPRLEYWSGLPFLTPQDLPDPGIKPVFLASPSLAGGFFTAVPAGRGLVSTQVSEIALGCRGSGKT